MSVLSTFSGGTPVTWSSSASKSSTIGFFCEYGQFTNPAAQMNGPCSTAAVDGWCVCNSQTYGIMSSGSNVCGYTAPPPTGTTSICGGPTSTTTSAPSPSVSCSVDYDSAFIASWDKFGICGTDFDNQMDDVGNLLKGALEECGALTEWRWSTPWNGCDFVASGRLGIGNKGCIENAIAIAGGPTNPSCS